MEEAPYVEPEDREVVVKNSVVGITPIDHKVQDTDLFKMKYPSILGNEFAGEIVAMGDKVEGLKVKQRVLGKRQLFWTVRNTYEPFAD